jgi:hypothetical protein
MAEVRLHRLQEGGRTRRQALEFGQNARDRAAIARAQARDKLVPIAVVAGLGHNPTFTMMRLPTDQGMNRCGCVHNAWVGIFVELCAAIGHPQ